MKAVVIVVEGVGAMMLGPYGSSTSTTPALNRLAASGLLLDQCFVDSFSLPDQMRSLWTGQHANGFATTWSVWKAWQDSGIPAQLITDSPEIAALAQQYEVPQVTLVNVTSATEAAESAEQCNLMQVFAAAMEILAAEETTGVVWIHSQGLRHAWDAPVELREAMIDPEDPSPPTEVHCPEIELDEDSDPDLALGWSQVAAAQLAVLDEAIDALEQTIAARQDAAEWTWLFCTLGGIPLGEHHTLGLAQQVGYIEEVAVAAIIRTPQNSIVSVRRAELCQLPDLPITLMHAMNLPANLEVWGRSQLLAGPPLQSIAWAKEQSIAFMESTEHCWLRTPAWSLLLTSESQELYVKPDDRWEVNNIADRGSDIAAMLIELVPQVRQAVANSQRHTLPQLPEELTNMIRN